MGFDQFSACFRIAAAIACMTQLTSPASANDTARITPLGEVRIDKWADIPPTFSLAGHIVDDEKNPVRWARIFIRDTIGGKSGERELAKSGRDGAFKIAERLTPSTRLIIRHKMFAPRYTLAGALFNGEDHDTNIEIIPYTERFDITPQGGIYKSGELTLDVPSGAVLKPVTILAAQLPLDYAYNHDGRVEPLRLTAVDLKPHRFEFKKPVTLTMTIAREDLPEVSAPMSYYYNDKLDRYIRDPETTVEVDEYRVAMTLSHFSPHAVVDGTMAQSTQILGRGSDLSGDGKITPSDALFMLLTSGGTHEATARFVQSITGSVMHEPAGKQAAGYSGSSVLPRDEAARIAEKYSLSRQWEKTITATLDVASDEYEFECRMLLGRYEFHRGVGWARVTPGSAEMAMIEQAWKVGQQGESSDAGPGDFKYFEWQGADTHLVAQALPDRHTLAVTMGDAGLEVFTGRDSHIIAKLRGTAIRECPNETEPVLWESADKAIEGVRGRKARLAAMAENFHFGSTSGTESGAPWGTFSRDDLAIYKDMNCHSEAHQVWNYAVTWEETLANTHIWTTSEIPDQGNPDRLASSVEWWIRNDSPSHFSEHLTAGLFKDTPDGPIPFGFMLHRIDERPCGAMLATSAPARPAPDEPVAPDPEQNGPYGIASRDGPVKAD